MRVLFIEHEHLTPPAMVGERFADRGIDITVHRVVPAERWSAPDVETVLPDATDFDYLVPLGAPWSVYDDAAVGSWVRPELDWLRAADAVGVPILGVCFGGQLLAEALGGSVALSPHPEIGWVEVESTVSALRGPWFQWHFDRFTVPADATELARNNAAPQAWRLRRNLALQFHPEVDEALARVWAEGEAAAAEARAHGVDPDALVADTRRREPDARLRAHALVDYFLDTVARDRD